MNLLLLTLASVAFPGGVIGLLFKIAIVCVVVWVIWSIGTWALAKSGKTVPYPLVIIFWGVVAIIIIYWLFELVQMIL
jgi:hypothetical protein